VEPIDRLRALGADPRERAPWLLCGDSSRVQGWKLHVTTTPARLDATLAAVVPELLRAQTPFKVARDVGVLAHLNEGAYGATQVGKALTVYPHDDDRAGALAERLAELTASLPGPAVPSDVHVGGAVYARYGGFNPVVERDRLGQLGLFIRAPDGRLVRDAYAVPFERPAWAPALFEPAPPAPSAPLLGPGYRVLDVLKAHAKGSTLLALDMRAPERVAPWVLKEGRAHTMADALGRDVRDRLRAQERLARRLAGSGLLPGVEPYFEVRGHGYLPVAFVPGHDLFADLHGGIALLAGADRALQLARLAQLGDKVLALHRAGIVHRDLAPGNVRVDRDGAVWLLDWELAWALDDPAPPFTKGTPGFMSPQQEADGPASRADDVFALGALLVCGFGGVDPRRLLHVPDGERAQRLAMLMRVEADVAAFATACMAPEPGRRPEMAAVAERLDAWATRAQPPRATMPTAQARAAVERVLAAAPAGLLHGTLQSPDGLWLSHAFDRARIDFGSEPERHRSANRGVAGPVYALARLARAGVIAEALRAAAPARVEQAIDWLLAHEPTADDQLPGLHFGEAGVAVAIAEAVRAGLCPPGDWLIPYLEEALSGPLDWPDVTHGAAGQGFAALLCAPELGAARALELSARCADWLIAAQDADGGWTMPDGVDGMSGTRLHGFAHGGAGVVCFLAQHAAASGDAAAAEAAARGFAWLAHGADVARDGHGRAAATWTNTEGEPERWSWWCHGAPGIALAFLRLAELSGGDAAAVAWAQAAMRSWDVRRSPSSNLSQCHGLSGLGEVCLEAERVLGPGWRAGADHVAERLAALARVDGDLGATWLVEDPYVPTADLMVGCGGVALFLARWAAPTGAVGLPLMPPLPAGAPVEVGRRIAAALPPLPADAAASPARAPRPVGV